jgi:hypothetical protein
VGVCEGVDVGWGTVGLGVVEGCGVSEGSGVEEGASGRVGSLVCAAVFAGCVFEKAVEQPITHKEPIKNTDKRDKIFVFCIQRPFKPIPLFMFNQRVGQGFTGVLPILLAFIIACSTAW